jgi:hypothetical protein
MTKDELQSYFIKPISLDEAKKMGLTKDQIYNSVKKGWLVNIKRFDDWGRIIRGKGLFVIPENNEPEYDTKTLQGIWK